jgi:hypothetical protein
MNTPAAFIYLPTFDGILSYAFVREVFKQKKLTFIQKLFDDPETTPDFAGMPICLHPDGYFIASKMFFDESELIEDTQRWRKRWDQKHQNLADFGKKLRQVEIVRGQFKSYDVPISTKLIRNCWFVFQSDDIKQVEYLIENWIFFIGKKRSQGYGEIKSFAIEETVFDFDTIYRPIPKILVSPETMIKTGTITFSYCAWKPPYWSPGNFAECVI